MALKAALSVLLACLCYATAKPYGGSECQGVIDFPIAVSVAADLLVVVRQRAGGRSCDEGEGGVCLQRACG